MRWEQLKARLLAQGSARVTGEPVNGYLSCSTAGPGAGGGGSVFFSREGRRARLSVDPGSPLELRHLGGGRAILVLDGRDIAGRLEEPALHCPRQAYITVSSGCIFSCRYCEVPRQPQRRKPAGEIEALVEAVRDRVDCISLTSGVMGSVEEEEDDVVSVVERLSRFGLPIAVSIYPTARTPERLHALGVAEVKFNVEAATGPLFAAMCPGLSWVAIWEALARSVPLFGRGHVFSNLIIGLGETDREVEDCVRRLAGMGVVAVIRPLNPAGELKSFTRPTAERLLHLHAIHRQVLQEAGLDPREGISMCIACTGCDLVPGRDED